MRARVMAVRVATHNPFLRDLTRAYVLLVSAAATAFLLVFLSYYFSPVPHPALQPNEAETATRYTGSIMTDEPRGDLCWERVFDNRTGRMWDIGYVKCDTQPAELTDPNHRTVLNMWRVQEVGKAFRR
jgi:hypothetical protein